MQFCSECANMLYPKADKESKTLLYACRNCEHEEKAEDYCVYRNQVMSTVGVEINITPDVAADPTLPRTKGAKCGKCGGLEAVFFQATSGRADEGMTLVFVCCNPTCGNRWRE